MTEPGWSSGRCEPASSGLSAPAVVWAALTEPKQVEQWFSRAEIDGRAGGRVWFAGQKDRPVSGRVLVWEPPRIFEHEWHNPPLADSVVRYELVAEGDATLLTVRDRLEAQLAGTEVPDWQPLAMSYWDTYNG